MKITFFVLLMQVYLATNAQQKDSCSFKLDSMKNTFYHLICDDNRWPETYLKVNLTVDANKEVTAIVQKLTLWQYAKEVLKIPEDSIDNYLNIGIKTNRKYSYASLKSFYDNFTIIDPDKFLEIKNLSLQEVYDTYFNRGIELKPEYRSFKPYIAAYLYDKYVLLYDYYDLKQVINFNTYMPFSNSNCFK